MLLITLSLKHQEEHYPHRKESQETIRQEGIPTHQPPQDLQDHQDHQDPQHQDLGRPLGTEDPQPASMGWRQTVQRRMMKKEERGNRKRMNMMKEEKRRNRSGLTLI